MLNFRQALLKHVAPRLKTLGYDYDDVLKEGNTVYGFHKHLGDNVRTIIQFIRRLDEKERAFGYGFTVKLERVKIPNLAQWNEGGYKGAVAPELSYLLWVSYGLRIYPHIHHVWEPATEQESKTAFGDVLDKLERYGLPWLENVRSRAAMPFRLDKWNEFQQALSAVVMPELMALGYEMREDTYQQWIPSRGRPQHHFVKVLKGDLHAFVIFHPFLYVYWSNPDSDTGYDISPAQRYYDVLLFRKRSMDPYDQNWVSDEDCFELWLGQQLEEGSDLNYRGPSLSPLWEYTHQEELTAQLKDTLDKVTRYGTPLLENMRSKRS